MNWEKIEKLASEVMGEEALLEQFLTVCAEIDQERVLAALMGVLAVVGEVPNASL